MADKLLFVADQHHMYNLENKVIGKFGREFALRLIGDITPSHALEQEDTPLKTIQRKYNLRNGYPENLEWPFEDKLKMNEAGIREAFETTPPLALEFTVFYGGASISNLVRKFFIHANSREKVLCLQGNEPIMDHAQKIIYSLIMEKEGKRNEDLIEYFFDETLRNRYDIHSLLIEQLSESAEISKGVKEFILDKLNISNYGGKVPLCSDVFRGKPNLSRFQFIETIHTEQRDGCAIIYVPYFSGKAECDNAIEFAKTNLSQMVKGEIPIIAYHGNPYPEGIKNCPDLVNRKDYNLDIIQAVADVAGNLFPNKEIKIICSHLHKSYSPYFWQFKEREIKLIPLGTDDMALLDPKSGEISVQKY